ncbi:uncharacterized protein EV420DRAFT_292387 [Desarmillaria tabescens]|uniref:Mid2 domain-containing protein n=1 Tax=Armillaria tabescens TaxID=1929756 RepID=A0AA39KEV6_ARMTA|nr:uncharacterized protein EV420DRAFT_292387 [Desarmillaria tabescens]KAK0459820.1 hypothetical protein EV420DRAFT_292387 [Desarmillaria tabescens]
MLFLPWRTWAVLFPLVKLVPLVASQVTQVTCNASIDSNWSYNSLNQSSCVVASYLGGVCNSGNFTVTPLSEGDLYAGPTLAQANSCRCSSVFYSLISACALCQGRIYERWSLFHTNCTENLNIPVGKFNDAIPAQTAVPHWAYQNVSVTDTFDEQEARSDSDAPESTAQPTSTSTSTFPSASSGVTSQKRTNVGAIVGGVIGGVALIALLGLGIWFIRLRFRSNHESEPILAADMDTHPRNFITLPVGQAAPKLYDPSDPSTYPISSPSPVSSANTHTYGTHQTVASAYSGLALPSNRTYSGVPEL